MYVGPDHPMFQRPGYPEPPFAGPGYGRLPPGAVPPGARFDPIMPNNPLAIRPRGRGRPPFRYFKFIKFRGEPDYDEFGPPGFNNDMYM